MEIKTNAYQTPSMVEIQMDHTEVLCASTLFVLDPLFEEEDTNDWTNIF